MGHHCWMVLNDSWCLLVTLFVLATADLLFGHDEHSSIRQWAAAAWDLQHRGLSLSIKGASCFVLATIFWFIVVLVWARGISQLQPNWEDQLPAAVSRVLPIFLGFPKFHSFSFCCFGIFRRSNKWSNGVFLGQEISKSQIPSFALNILNRSQAWWAWWEHVTTEQSMQVLRTFGSCWSMHSVCALTHSVGRGQLRFRFPATRQNGHCKTKSSSRRVVTFGEFWSDLFDLVFHISQPDDKTLHVFTNCEVRKSAVGQPSQPSHDPFSHVHGTCNTSELWGEDAADGGLEILRPGSLAQPKFPNRLNVYDTFMTV